jgi:hypothetical protein
MVLSEVYSALAPEEFSKLLKAVSLGTVKTYNLFERLKIRFRVTKLNSETMRTIGPKLQARLKEGDEDLATELGQAILICHMPMIIDVLNHVGLPHEEGFFSKDVDPKQHLKDGWQQNAFDGLKDKHDPTLLRFYLNHLQFELEPEKAPF